MKLNHYILLFLLAVPFKSYCQKIVVGKTPTGSYVELGSEGYVMEAYEAQNLDNAMKKAISWAQINTTKRMTFEKEIIRIRTMDKQTYAFHGYVEQFTKEGIVSFSGYNNGSFICKIIFNVGEPNSNEITFPTIQAINVFIRVLEGKGSNPAVDDVFH